MFYALIQPVFFKTLQKENNLAYSDEDVLFFERQLDLFGKLAHVSTKRFELSFQIVWIPLAVYRRQNMQQNMAVETDRKYHHLLSNHGAYMYIIFLKEAKSSVIFKKI